jgi:hypothetical protein
MIENVRGLIFCTINIYFLPSFVIKKNDIIMKKNTIFYFLKNTKRKIDKKYILLL